MNTLKQLIEEQNKELIEDYQCTGRYCPHETSEKHFVITLDWHKQSQIALIKAVVEKIDVLNKIDRLGMWSDGLEILKQDLLQELKEIES